jgi:hypothetical protein
VLNFSLSRDTLLSKPYFIMSDQEEGGEAPAEAPEGDAPEGGADEGEAAEVAEEAPAAEAAAPAAAPAAAEDKKPDEVQKAKCCLLL